MTKLYREEAPKAKRGVLAPVIATMSTIAALIMGVVMVSTSNGCAGVKVTPPPVSASPVVLPGKTVALLQLAQSSLPSVCSSITWSVVEGTAGGTVDANGNFTAVNCGTGTGVVFNPGLYNVKATGCGQTVTIPVAVVEAVTKVAIACAVVAPSTTCATDPTNVTVMPGGKIQFYARLTYTCGRTVITPTPPAGLVIPPPPVPT